MSIRINYENLGYRQKRIAANYQHTQDRKSVCNTTVRLHRSNYLTNNASRSAEFSTYDEKEN
jgi:hypothetical protein